MKRRNFLKTAAATSAALSAQYVGYHVSGAASPRDSNARNNPVLVVIYLRGGQDQLNIFVPHGDPSYYKIRPTIAVPKQKLVRLDDFWGLHPALSPLKPYYDSGRFASVINSGSPHSTRSHFDAQDFMEYAAPGDRSIRDGWLNRYLSATASRPNTNPLKSGNTKTKSKKDTLELRALAMQELLPRSLRGSEPVLAAPENLEQLNDVLDVFEGFYTDGSKPTHGGSFKTEPDPVLASGRDTIDSLRRLQQILKGHSQDRELGTKAVQEYPGGYFASRLQKLARVIKQDVGLEVCAMDVNGWDHHIGLGSTDGALNRMLTFVAQGLATFMKDLGPHLDRTLIMLNTEFGRVCKENGNAGADHGHGGAVWLLGGGLKGGKIFGDWTGLEEKTLYKKRDLPVTTDFRAVFTEVLQNHMKFEVNKGFFPNYRLPKTELGLFT